MSALPAVQRLNGKWYRPRRSGLKAVFCMDYSYSDNSDYLYILGTHNVETARPFATECVQWKWGHRGVTDPIRTWVRDAYDRSGQAWIYDPVRGCAAVGFTPTDDVEENR